MSYDYDNAARWAEANEWKEELRRQKLPDEPLWHSVVKVPEPEGRTLLSIKVFRHAGGKGACYVRADGAEEAVYTEHDTVSAALEYAHKFETVKLATALKGFS